MIGEIILEVVGIVILMSGAVGLIGLAFFASQLGGITNDSKRRK